MASIRMRMRSPKSKLAPVFFQVMWREDGEQTSLSFDADRTEGGRWKTDEPPAAAKAFKAVLEADGPDAARAWLATYSPEPEPDAEPDAAEMLDAAVEHYINHLPNISEGTRDEYHRLYRRTWGRATCDATGGEPLGQQPRGSVRTDTLAEVVIHDLGRRLKLKSIENARGLLSAAYNAWVDDPDCEITHNPCRRLALPKMQYDEEELEEELCLLTHAEFQLIFDELDDHWQPLVYYLVGTGCRWSEATALDVRRARIDADGKPKSRITRAWKKIPGGYELGSPKTRRSIRDIDLQPELDVVVAAQSKGKKKTDLLFTAREGGRVRHSNFYNRVWLPALWRASLCAEHRAHACGCVLRKPIRCKRHNCPPPEACGCSGTLTKRPRIHDLRHVHVAWTVAAGAQLPWVSRRLGHESIQTTWDIYGDVLPELRIVSVEFASKALAPVKVKLPEAA